MFWYLSILFVIIGMIFCKVFNGNDIIEYRFFQIKFNTVNYVHFKFLVVKVLRAC